MVDVCVWRIGGGSFMKKKKCVGGALSLTPDDIFGNTSKMSMGGRGKSVQATHRVLLLPALLLKKIQASMCLCVAVCVIYASVGLLVMCSFSLSLSLYFSYFIFLIHKRIGGL